MNYYYKSSNFISPPSIEFRKPTQCLHVNLSGHPTFSITTKVQPSTIELFTFHTSSESPSSETLVNVFSDNFNEIECNLIKGRAEFDHITLILGEPVCLPLDENGKYEIYLQMAIVASKDMPVGLVKLKGVPFMSRRRSPPMDGVESFLKKLSMGDLSHRPSKFQWLMRNKK